MGGKVKVLVRREEMKYGVYIEVSALPEWNSQHDLVLSWGIFRSDSSHLMVLNEQGTAQDASESLSEATLQTPFVEKSLGRHAAELEFNSNQSPFYLSFLLCSSLGGSSVNLDIRSHRKTKFCVPVGIGSGFPTPLGLSFSGSGLVNFSLFSRNAERVILCLYAEKQSEPSLEVDLDPYVNRTGDIWHVSIDNIDRFVNYGYRCKGDILWEKGGRFDERHVLLDPYARVIGNFFPDQDKSLSFAKCLGRLCKEPSFDWTDHVPPCLPMEKLMVYRLNVGQFTKDKSSKLPRDVAGTFTGVIEKLSHFKSLGINAVLLEPIFPFDEQKGPYFPYHFFSPLNLYGINHDGVSAITSMKDMVKTLHANGIEVLLEVVFTSTVEGGDAACQTISFRGIDSSLYYLFDRNAEQTTDNALNCNHPVVQRMILDSLQYWVTEFHVDGFCFMNAASLTRGLSGEHLSCPPLIEAIAFDPILSNTKIIADCWSSVDMTYKEIRFPHWKRWAEMNTNFCHDVRNFIRGEGLLSDFATRLCGSGDIFSDGRGPSFSFNYVARNFGFHLVDLVSFSSSDYSSQLSWNCGEEGPTNNAVVLDTRRRQIHNFLFVLYISLGVPVLNMGDECGQSTAGSPSYNDRKPFDWNSLKTSFAVQTMQFIAFLSSLRIRRNGLLQKRNFMMVENISWGGSNQSPPKWEDPSCKFIAVTLASDDEDDSSDRGNLFVAFNAGKSEESLTLPQLSEGESWFRLVDTALPFPGFFLEDGEPVIEDTSGLTTYEMESHSCVLFEAKSSSS
ncbi:hypothetical protein ACLOJK_025935 [Asimina triloba]